MKPKPRKEAFYFDYYIQLPKQEDLLFALESASKATEIVCSNCSEESGNFKYAPEKWTFKQVLNHLIDTERILCTGALHFARKDTTFLPDFDEDSFAKNDNTEHLTIIALLEEYKALRLATCLFFKHINADHLDYVGNAGGNEISVRELGWTIAGHDLHHLQVIKERYLPHFKF